MATHFCARFSVRSGLCNRVLQNLLAVALLAAAAAAHPAANLAYRCDAADGSVTLSQYPCAADARPILPSDSVIIAAPPLSAAERQQLARLQRERQQRSERRVKARLQEDAENRRKRAEAQRLCDGAKSALAELKSVRRHGYSLAESARLDRERARLEIQKKTNC